MGRGRCGDETAAGQDARDDEVDWVPRQSCGRKKTARGATRSAGWRLALSGFDSVATRVGRPNGEVLWQRRGGLSRRSSSGVWCVHGRVQGSSWMTTQWSLGRQVGRYFVYSASMCGVSSVRMRDSVRLGLLEGPLWRLLIFWATTWHRRSSHVL